MDERTLDTTPSGGGRLDGPPGRLDEVAAQRTKTRALVLQRLRHAPVRHRCVLADLAAVIATTG